MLQPWPERDRRVTNSRGRAADRHPRGHPGPERRGPGSSCHSVVMGHQAVVQLHPPSITESCWSPLTRPTTPLTPSDTVFPLNPALFRARTQPSLKKCTPEPPVYTTDWPSGCVRG